MGGNATCVPPNFNTTMESVWVELWNSMPQSGKVGVTVKQLQHYKERCQIERKSQLDMDESPLALLPVSFAQAKDWLLKQQRAHSVAIEVGTVNEAARQVVSELRQALSDQPTSTARLLELPPRPASPAIPTPQFSFGPEQISDATRAEEHARQNPPKKRTRAQPSQKTKKPKLIPPELGGNNYRCSVCHSHTCTFSSGRKSEGKRLCSVCHQLRTIKDKTPNGDIHRVLGRSNKIWCPYSDPKSILEAFEKEQKERTQESWRRANEAKKLKKQSAN